MPVYHVTRTFSGYNTILIEADSEDEARDKAELIPCDYIDDALPMEVEHWEVEVDTFKDMILYPCIYSKLSTQSQKDLWCSLSDRVKLINYDNSFELFHRLHLPDDDNLYNEDGSPYEGD